MTLRYIQPADDPVIYTIIRTALTEYGGDIPGTAWSDPQLKSLSEWYAQPRRAYWVVEHQGVVVGGGGVGPLQGEAANVGELQKMYLAKEARGQGFGKRLIERILEEARLMGYDYCYLETLPAMTLATHLYEASGFRRLDAPMGNTGHHECGLCYGKDLV